MSLYLWARPVLTPEQIATVLAGLVPPANQVGAWTYEQMRGVQDRMRQAQLPLDTQYARDVAWLEKRDVRTLENIDQLNWLYVEVQEIDRHEIGRQEFSVRWTGTLRGARGRDLYVVDLSVGFELRACRHVPPSRRQRSGSAQQQILDSTANGWTSRATPVALAGRRAGAAARGTVLRLQQSRRNR